MCVFSLLSTNKLSSRSVACVFFGYASHYKGYHCLDPITNRVRALSPSSSSFLNLSEILSLTHIANVVTQPLASYPMIDAPIPTSTLPLPKPTPHTEPLPQPASQPNLSSSFFYFPTCGL